MSLKKNNWSNSNCKLAWILQFLFHFQIRNDGYQNFNNYNTVMDRTWMLICLDWGTNQCSLILPLSSKKTIVHFNIWDTMLVVSFVTVSWESTEIKAEVVLVLNSTIFMPFPNSIQSGLLTWYRIENQTLLNPIIPFTNGWILIQIKECAYVFQPANSHHCPINFTHSDMKSHTATIISNNIETHLTYSTGTLFYRISNKLSMK